VLGTAGSGRMCQGAFAHGDFVVRVRFSQLYVPLQGADAIRRAYNAWLDSIIYPAS
jgi:hypothetical protein